MNLTELLDSAASHRPGKPAIIEGETVLSYSELMADIAAWSAQLESHGVAPGQRVGLCLPNSIAYVALTFAVWRAGGVVVPISAECTDEETATIAGSMHLDAFLGRKPREGSKALRPGIFFTRLAFDNSWTPRSSKNVLDASSHPDKLTNRQESRLTHHLCLSF